jgi:hypothetical protein
LEVNIPKVKLLRFIVISALMKGAVLHGHLLDIQNDDKLPIGQLLYINVDGFGESPSPIHPSYVELVRELGIGGVLPHFSEKDTKAIYTSLEKLQNASLSPLLIGMDYTPLVAPLSGVKGWAGFGFGAGILGKYGERLNENCLRKLVILQALLHRLLGYNHVLGPTIDRSARYGSLDQSAETIRPKVEMCLMELEHFGLTATVKHFPYTPSRFSLHEENHDLPLNAEEVKEKMRIFHHVLPKAPAVMTTHLYNSTVDPSAPATFSKTWLDKLESMGFQGIIFSDALMMIDGHNTLLQEKGWLTLEGEPNISNPSSVFAIKAILAGHDMVILEGHAEDTRKVFRDLDYLINKTTPLGKSFKDRAKQSLEKLAAFKKQRQNLLLKRPQYKPEVIERVITLMNLVLNHHQDACTDQTYWKSLEPFVRELMVGPGND